MNKEEIKTPDILLTALRQYQHNDCSGLLAGFDYEETIKIVLHLLSNPQQSQWISVNDRLPDRDDIVRWWLVGKTEEEAWKDSDGKPICPNRPPYMYECKYRCWSAIMKPSHWQPLPSPPQTDDKEGV